MYDNNLENSSCSSNEVVGHGLLVNHFYNVAQREIGLGVST
ncbi:hypothetical protein ACVNP0_00780 [Staphylococcus aureus]